MDLEGIRLIDQHAHPLLPPEAVAAHPWHAFLTEASAPEAVSQASSTLFVRRSVRDMAGLLGCGDTEADVAEARARRSLDDLARTCLGAAGLEMALLDDGLNLGEALPLAWHARHLPVRRVLRLETLAEQLLSPDLDFGAFVEAFRASLDPPGEDVVALKTVAAYRAGLRIEAAPVDEVRAAYDRWRDRVLRQGGHRRRLDESPLVHHLVLQALELARRHRLPVQVHCGFGDPDLDLREATPLHLRPVLEDRRFREVPLVLLHGAWPFTREAAWLAAVYPHVHLDLGLAIPFLSVRGMRDVVAMALDVAPTTRILYSSDASRIPDLFYLGARWGRRVVGDALESAMRDGDLDAGEAEGAALRILRDNASELYQVGAP